MFITKTVLKLANIDDGLVIIMQKRSLRMNYAYKIIFDNGKPMSSNSLQFRVHLYLRETLKLKSHMSCNLPLQVAGFNKILTLIDDFFLQERF